MVIGNLSHLNIGIYIRISNTVFYSSSSSTKSTHEFDFGAVLFEHSIAIAFKTTPYFFFSLAEARLHGIHLAKVDDNTVLRHVSDLLQRLI